MQFAIQLQQEHTLSGVLGPVAKVIAFTPIDDAGVNEALINEHILEQIADALGELPHKFRQTSNGTDWNCWESFNDPAW